MKIYSLTRSRPAKGGTALPFRFLKYVFICLFVLAIVIGGGLIFRQNAVAPTLRTSQVLNVEKTLIFVGDIMLARGVDYQMRKNSDYKFPFLKIAEELNCSACLPAGRDLTIGNLEGPIVENSEIVPANSLNFNFNPRILEGLKFAGFDVVSLANNHLLDKGWEGFEQTKNYLAQAGINYFGDPVGCGEKDILLKDNFVFVGINKTYPQNCSDEEIVELIKTVKEKNPEKLLIVMMHWGEEYQKQANQKQKDLARVMIDSGADLIIGSHPHMVQEIEEYKEKYIAYSLGNFVFDQNFSKETMEGLMLKVVIVGNEIKSVESIKIQINKTFQPELINL